MPKNSTFFLNYERRKATQHYIRSEKKPLTRGTTETASSKKSTCQPVLMTDAVMQGSEALVMPLSLWRTQNRKSNEKGKHMRVWRSDQNVFSPKTIKVSIYPKNISATYMAFLEFANVLCLVGD